MFLNGLMTVFALGDGRGGSIAQHGFRQGNRVHFESYPARSPHLFVFSDNDGQGGKVAACLPSEPRQSSSVDKV